MGGEEKQRMDPASLSSSGPADAHGHPRGHPRGRVQAKGMSSFSWEGRPETQSSAWGLMQGLQHKHGLEHRRLANKPHHPASSPFRAKPRTLRGPPPPTPQSARCRAQPSLGEEETVPR